jgi:hypothetical protein
MSHSFSQAVKVFLLSCLGIFLCLPQTAMAQSHIVSTEDLNKDVAAAAASRERNINEVDQFFASPNAQKALNAAHLNVEEVKNAVSVISDDDLARLAERSAKAQRDFAAGSLTNEQLTYIVIALATAVIILVIVKA